MSKKYQVKSFLLPLAVLLCAQLLYASGEMYISKLSLNGINKIKRSEINKVIRLRNPSVFEFLPWIKPVEYDEGRLRDDINNLKKYYQSMGYYHAEINYSVLKNIKRSSAEIKIEVIEGEPVIVKIIKLDISGEGVEIPETEIQGQLLLKKGNPFEIDLYEASKDKIEEYLSDRGYPGVKVSGKVVVDKISYSTTVIFVVNTGPLRYFGPLSLSGNDVIKTEFILREITFTEGDRFSRGELFRSQKNIFRLDLFNLVILRPADTKENINVPVKLELEEKQRRVLNLGVGYGSEDKFRAQAGWARRYFLQKPITLNILLKYSSILWSGSADLYKVHFIDRNTNLNIHFGYDKEFYTSYNNEKMGSQARIGRVISKNTDVFAAYNLEVNRPVNIDDQTLLELKETKEGDFYFISGILSGVKWDTTQGALSPRKGWMSSLFFELSSFILGSSLDYIKGVAEVRNYQNISGEYVLAKRANFGFIKPFRFTSDIPIFKRYFLGGSNSVRGYGFQEIGPKDSEGNSVGGHFTASGNIELRHPLYKNLKGAIFIDIGNVFKNAKDMDFSDMKYSTGAGLRYDTIIGPIRIDLAFPVDPFPEIETARYRIYFSIGNTF